jgi:DMSO/TMAO reductase YedYZ molybdopterin-dependent catalytic subunit
MGLVSRGFHGRRREGPSDRVPPGQYEPGFWESNGYHLRGDPWLEQRYWGD